MAQSKTPLMVSLIHHPSSGRIQLPIGWQSLENNSLLRFRHNPETEIASSKRQKLLLKVAAFDFDHTLWKLSFKRAFDFPEGLMFSNTHEKLSELHDSGYKLCILSNECIEYTKNLDTAKKHVNKKLKAVGAFLDNVVPDLPVDVFLATRYDKFRKPSTKDREKRRGGGIGMWESVSQEEIDKENSFYVGDAAGRKKDFSDADIRFAEQVGVKFLTPEEYFL